MEQMDVPKFCMWRDYLGLNELLMEECSQARLQRPARPPKFSCWQRPWTQVVLQKLSDASVPWCKAQCRQETMQRASDADKDTVGKEQHSQVSRSRSSDDDGDMMTQGQNPLHKSKDRARSTCRAKKQNPSQRDRMPPIDHSKRNLDLYHCTFCRNNDEYHWAYTGHGLRDQQGNVACPRLRRYTCRQCGASGDKAHTRKFCPMTCKTNTSTYRSASNAKPTRKE